jgi:hypothetical protein
VNGLKADLTVLVDGVLGTADSTSEPAEPPAQLPTGAGDDTNEPSAGGPGAAGPADPPAAVADAAEAGVIADAAVVNLDPTIPAPAGQDEARPIEAQQIDARPIHGATPAEHPTDDDEEPVLPVQAYRDRASYTPERYLIVRPLAEEKGRAINPEVLERVSSVLRQRSPALVEPQPAA